MSMKPRPAAACEHCGDVGKQRWINDGLQFRTTRIGVVLCQKCYKALRQADARAWAWFREYRDRPAK